VSGPGETDFFPGAVALQFSVAHGDPEKNLARVRAFFSAGCWETGTLVVLPELWATGFAYSHCQKLAQETPALLISLQELAAESGVLIAGSLLEPPGKEDGDKPAWLDQISQPQPSMKIPDSGMGRPLLPGFSDKPWNTLFVVDGNGVVGRYRKQHLFSYWKEDRFFSPGDCLYPLSTSGGLLGPLVCYDLRFPEIAARHAFAGAQLLLVSAQWPRSRLEHWRILLRARAVENQLYVVACNSCGVAGEIVFAGHSMVVAPDGRIMAEASEGEEALSCSLSQGEVEGLRSRFCSVAERPWLGRDGDKICTLEELRRRIETVRRQGSRVAFTNGCFDLLHPGHVSYLEQARRSADLLVVGLNSDASVRRLKGESRPVNNERDRARVLAALGCVDLVTIFEEDTPERLIKALLPDVLVKGADWEEDEIVGAAEVKAAGGRVERIPFAYQNSTTATIKKIQQ